MDVQRARFFRARSQSAVSERALLDSHPPLLRAILQCAMSQVRDDTSHGGGELILATTTVEDFDRFLSVFATKGAEKRKVYGCKGATVFRDPNEDDRVWVLYDWDEGAFKTSSPTPRSRRSFKKPATNAGPGGGALRPVRLLAPGSRLRPLKPPGCVE